MVQNSRARGFIHNQSNRKVCWFGKLSSKKHQKFDRSRKWEKHNQRPTSVQLGHETSLRNARFKVKKDVCMLKTIKDPQPSRNPQSIVQSEPSQNPCNMYSIYKKKPNNEPQHEQNQVLCKNVSNILTSETNADSCREFMNEACCFSCKKWQIQLINVRNNIINAV